MVNLMLAVELEFDIAIPQADITPENFQSLRLDRGAGRTDPGAARLSGALVERTPTSASTSPSLVSPLVAQIRTTSRPSNVVGRHPGAAGGHHAAHQGAHIAQRRGRNDVEHRQRRIVRDASSPGRAAAP